MGIFNELYGSYFRIAARILKYETITKAQINQIITSDGFRDSILFLPQKLIPQNDGSDWGLLKNNSDGSFSPIIRNKPLHILSTLQKRWIKTKLRDPKIRLFLDDNVINDLDERLKNTVPLYSYNIFRYTDRFADGDDFENENYRKNFRIILNGVKENKILKIGFTSGRERKICHNYAPIKIEYSAKNNKFRIYCLSMKNGRISGSGIINIGRIYSVSDTGKTLLCTPNHEKYFSTRRSFEPVKIRVSPERNGIERFLAEFASYEKCTVLDPESGSCTSEIYYDRQDETELLIRLLSFGPIIEILSPPRFRNLAAERVKAQYKLFSQGKF